MKKLICILLTASLLLAMTACGGTKPAEESEKPQVDASQQEQAETPEPEETAASEPAEAGDWTREGYFQDENGNFLSVTWMEDIDEPGWYVGVMLGEDPIEDSYGGILQPEGNTLKGSLPSGGEKDALTVTVSEEGEEGVQLAVEGGETYHLAVMDIPEATIFVNISVDGMGNIAYNEGEEAPEIDPEYPFQSAVINLAEPTTHTFAAWPDAGYKFVKWTKNGEDFSTEQQFTVLLDESAEYVAVFEEDPDWVNPLEPFFGEYQCDRAHAQVDSFNSEDLLIVIEWGGSALETARWTIFSRFDPETMTVAYTDCQKCSVFYNENGEQESEEVVYSDGTGTIVFNEDGTFTWHEDQSETGTDMVFEKLPSE
ncbi:MAG: hypothetical protein IJJ50_03740 [Lachnospiraceae bacterium]|nr:hypothetical protein [Lachnospiraceae bacterium]